MWGWELGVSGLHLRADGGCERGGPALTKAALFGLLTGGTLSPFCCWVICTQRQFDTYFATRDFCEGETTPEKLPRQLSAHVVYYGEGKLEN